MPFLRSPPYSILRLEEFMHDRPHRPHPRGCASGSSGRGQGQMVQRQQGLWLRDDGRRLARCVPADGDPAPRRLRRCPRGRVDHLRGGRGRQGDRSSPASSVHRSPAPPIAAELRRRGAARARRAPWRAPSNGSSPTRATASSPPMAAARTCSFTSPRCAAAASRCWRPASGCGSRWSTGARASRLTTSALIILDSLWRTPRRRRRNPGIGTFRFSLSVFTL